MYFIFNNPLFRKSCHLWANVEKHGTAEETTDNVTHSLCMSVNWGYKHTLRISNNLCSSTDAMVTRTYQKTTVIRTLPVLLTHSSIYLYHVFNIQSAFCRIQYLWLCIILTINNYYFPEQYIYIYIYIYIQVSKEEKTIFWEVIVSVILSKKLYMNMCPVPNGFRDRAIWLQT
jgi:hypothetical protein